MTQPSHTRPLTPVKVATDVLHGIEIADPYRWLEEQNSPQTRKWIEEQTHYARAYLDSIPGRDRIKERITEFLTVDSYEMPQRVGSRLFYRKRKAQQEQPCIYMRTDGETEAVLLVNPSEFSGDPYTSVSISQISADGHLLLYEVKRGGERSGRFEILDVDRRHTLPDCLPRGFLRGFMFSPDGRGFYYVHEIIGAKPIYHRAAYYHAFGARFGVDEEIFFAGAGPNLKLVMGGDAKQLCFIKAIVGGQIPTEYYLYNLTTKGPAKLAFTDAGHIFGVAFWHGRIFAMTDIDAPNLRIVEMLSNNTEAPESREVIPSSLVRMKTFTISEDRILVLYVENSYTCVRIFDLEGTRLHEVPFTAEGTTIVSLIGSTPNEIFYKHESFTRPATILRYLPKQQEHQVFAEVRIPLDTSDIVSIHTSYPSKDGTLIPIYLVGRNDVSPTVIRPTLLTGYGGFGTSMTPKFGALTSFMMEQGCLFALTCLRGGSEFGKEWHIAARGRNRQKAFDDFISAAEWLLLNGYTTPDQLAIFGGSNSGLLVGAALTQRPDLFRVALCLCPLLDMLRYQHFDFARKYQNEYGIAEDPDDFTSLHAYSPYHCVKNGTAYPAVLLVSGDMDMNCNPMHARKMTARLQAASSSGYPIILDYNPARGHKPVMPLSERIRGLTDRLAFLCDQLRISVTPTKGEVRGVRS
jgi:prolyl oligopeptidase